ncbi:hypothetical protein J6590_045180 [Homalodisca vitripennis]|nr:hypothetical protein J6590_045180 [Homalodisca vitripennis]
MSRYSCELTMAGSCGLWRTLRAVQVHTRELIMVRSKLFLLPSRDHFWLQKPMCHLNLGNLMDVQERHITNRKCRDSGVHSIGLRALEHEITRRNQGRRYMIDCFLFFEEGGGRAEALDETMTKDTRWAIHDGISFMYLKSGVARPQFIALTPFSSAQHQLSKHTSLGESRVDRADSGPYL